MRVIYVCTIYDVLVLENWGGGLGYTTVEAHVVSVVVTGGGDVEVAGDGGAREDVLRGHVEVRGHREGRGPGGCCRETKDTLDSQSLPQYLAVGNGGDVSIHVYLRGNVNAAKPVLY